MAINKKKLLKRIQNMEDLQSMRAVIDLLIERKVKELNVSKFKGEKGDRGPKPSTTEIARIVKTVVEQNKDKLRPTEEEVSKMLRDIFESHKDKLRGKDGRSPAQIEIENIVAGIVEGMKDDLRGEPGENPTPADVVTLIETFEGENRLDAKAIKNLEDNIDITKTNVGDLTLDASQISNLPKGKTIVKNVGGGGGSGLETIKSDGQIIKHGASTINFTGGATLTTTPNGVNVDIPSGGGDVSGPSSSTDNAIARFDGTDGKTLQDSGILIDDSDNVTGVNQLDIDSANGIDVNPGSDIDADLLTVGVTGSPTISWDESQDAFHFSKGIDIDDNIAITFGTGFDATLLWDGTDLILDYDSLGGGTTDFRIQENGTDRLIIETGGNIGIGVEPSLLLDLAASGAIGFAGTAILNDSAGTLTLSNVDALDATTESTIESAIDTLANLTSASSLATVGTITTGTWNGTDIAIADGGTGASSASAARSNLGLAIGSDVQAHGDVLDDLNTLGAATADGEFIVATGAGVFAYESGATARTSLGLGTGDSPQFTGIELGNASDTTLTRSAAGVLAVEGKNVATEFSKSITVEDPTDAEDISMFFTNQAITITEMRAVLVGSSTPSVTWTIRHGTDRSATGAEVVTSGTTTTSVSTGSDVTSFNDATVVADSFVWLETTAQSGTVDEIHITVFYTID